MPPPSAIQSGGPVQQGLSAAYESFAFCKHRRAADKRYSLGRTNASDLKCNTLSNQRSCTHGFTLFSARCQASHLHRSFPPPRPLFWRRGNLTKILSGGMQCNLFCCCYLPSRRSLRSPTFDRCHRRRCRRTLLKPRCLAMQGMKDGLAHILGTRRVHLSCHAPFLPPLSD